MTPFSEGPETTWVVGPAWRSALLARITEWIDTLPDDGVLVATEMTLEPTPATALGVFTSPPGKPWSPVLVTVLGDSVRTNALRGVPLADMESTAFFRRAETREKVTAEALRLSRADGLSPLEFSQRVADAFKFWALRVPNPALELARQNNVKPSTVHSWIREARLRGLLDPAGGQRPGPPSRRKSPSAGQSTTASREGGATE